MPQVTLSAGETEEIYQGKRGDALFLNTDGDIRFARSESFARSGRKIQADNSFEIELREDDERVFVHAEEDDVTVEYEKQGFSISLFERQVVYRPNDASTRYESQVYQSGAATVSGNGSGTMINWTNNEGRDLSMEFITCIAPGGSMDNLIYFVKIFDTDGNLKTALGGYVITSPLDLNPGLPVKENERVEIGCDNEAPEDNRIEATVVLR